MQRHKKTSRFNAVAALTALFLHMFFSSPALLIPAHAAADDYEVSGGDPGALPHVGDASVSLELITLTDTDGDDFSDIDGVETLEVAINTTDYPNVEFDTTVLGPLVLIGGTCGFTGTDSVNFTSSTTVELVLTGAGGGGNCGPGATITLNGLRVLTTAKTEAPLAPAPLISIDNKGSSAGNPIFSDTTFSYAILAQDAQATLTLQNPTIGDVGDATLALTLPAPLDQDDTLVLTLPGHFVSAGLDMATTGTLGGTSTFNCTVFGDTITCVADGPTNASGTVVLTGIVATSPSTDDASLLVTNEGNLNDILAEDPTVFTTDITAPADNVVTDISVQDANLNGKLDRILISVENESGYSAVSHSLEGWSVKNNNNDVTITSVVIDGQPDANPLNLQVYLDETDTDLDTNLTATEGIEITYAQQLLSDTGFELDDLSDLQLAEIAPGDLDDTNTEKDGAAPFITGRTTRDTNKDGKIDGVQLSFSENVSAASLTSAGFVITTGAGAPLTETYSDVVDDTTLFLGVTDAPVMNTADLLRVQVTGSLEDLFGNVLPTEGGPTAALDDASPVLKEWSYDVTTKKITMEWSEALTLVHSDITELILQDAPTATISYSLTGGDLSQPTPTSVAVVLNTTDQSAIDGMAGLLKARDNAYLRYESDLFDDLAGVSNNDLPDGSALQATTFVLTPVPTTVSRGGGGGGGGGGFISSTTAVSETPKASASVARSSRIAGEKLDPFRLVIRMTKAMEKNDYIELTTPIKVAGSPFDFLVRNIENPSVKLRLAIRKSSQKEGMTFRFYPGEDLAPGEYTFDIKGTANLPLDADEQKTYVQKVVTFTSKGNIIEDDFTLPDVVIENRKEKVIIPDVTFSKNTVGATDNAVTISYVHKHPVLVPGDRILVSIPGFNATEPTTTFSSPKEVKNKTRFANGLLIITLQEELPQGGFAFTTTGVKNPNIAGTPIISLSVQDAAGTPFIQSTKLIVPPIVDAPAPNDLVISQPLTKPTVSTSSVVIATPNIASPASGQTTQIITGQQGHLTLGGEGGQVLIPESTSVSVNSNANWNGTISAPTSIDSTLLEDLLRNMGNQNTNSSSVNRVVSVGSQQTSMSFSKPVSLQVPFDQAQLQNVIQATIASAANVTTDKVTLSVPVSVVTVGENNTVQQVSSSTLIADSCNALDYRCTVTRLTPGKNVIGETCSTNTGVKVIGISTLDSQSNSTTGTFLFGQKMRISPDDMTRSSVVRPGFGVRTNVCHFSTYAILLGKPQVISSEEAREIIRPFSDISEMHPFYEAIVTLKESSIMRGYAMGDFRPESDVNRAEFVKTLVVAQYGEPAPLEGESCFKDVPLDAWFAPYVCFAKDKGIISGYADGTFRPESTINLAEAAKILVETLNVETFSSSEGEEWFKPYLLALQYQKAIPLSFITPAQSVNRGSLAEMVWRLGTETKYLPSAQF